MFDDLYGDKPVMQAYAQYQEALRDGDQDLHKSILTVKSLAMLQENAYPADKMRLEYERVQGCGTPESLIEGDRALITFPEKQDMCFPYLIYFDYDRWLVDLYMMKLIFLVKPEERWTIKPEVKNHPYAFGIKKMTLKEGETIEYKKKF